jgi:lipopolysaccharide biosynthesis glycosyltransferase
MTAPRLFGAPRPRPPEGAGAHIRVLFCCDPGYYQHLAVALCSLFASNRRNFLEIHLISGERDGAAEGKLMASLSGFEQFSFELHEFTWPDKNDWHTSEHITAETYTRIHCPRVLGPAVDKVLYLDSDLLVVDDLAPLWATDIGDVALAAVPEPYGRDRDRTLGMPPGSTYINAGVLLINLERWRAEQVTERLCAYIRREGARLRQHDQDALNALLHDRTRLLDPRWNLQARAFHPCKAAARHRAALRRAAGSPAIIHYASSRKPWIFAVSIPRKGLYRRYLRMTAWRGAAPEGRSLARVPERAFNALLCALRLDTSWEELSQTTRLGKAVAWRGRWLLRRLSAVLLHRRAAVPVK